MCNNIYGTCIYMYSNINKILYPALWTYRAGDHVTFVYSNIVSQQIVMLAQTFKCGSFC